MFWNTGFWNVRLYNAWCFNKRGKMGQSPGSSGAWAACRAVAGCRLRDRPCVRKEMRWVQGLLYSAATRYWGRHGSSETWTQLTKCVVIPPRFMSARRRGREWGREGRTGKGESDYFGHQQGSHTSSLVGVANCRVLSKTFCVFRKKCLGVDLIQYLWRWYSQAL